MHWILIAYLLALIFLSTKLEDPARLMPFRAAWITFALIPICHFIMHLCRAGNVEDMRMLHLVGIWNEAIASLLLGISFLCLAGAIAPGQPSAVGEGTNQKNEDW